MSGILKKIINGINSVSGMDVSLLMICVGALGVLTGININDKRKNVISLISVFLFIVTSIPAISKIAGRMLENDNDEYFSDEECFEPEL